MDLYKTDFFARLIVTEAGKIVREKIQQKLDINTKKNAHDFVTNIDKTVEQFLTSQILKYFPNANIISEEGYGNSNSLSQNEITWVIDPIDGTSDLVYLKKDFAVVLSVYEYNKGKIVYINDVMNNKLYHSLDGYGCFENDIKFETRPQRPLIDSAIFSRFDFLDVNRSHSSDLIRKARSLASMSCASLGMVALAKGEVDGMINKGNMKPWDILPGMAFAKEANVKFLTTQGKEYNYSSNDNIIAAGNGLIEEMLNITKNN